MAIEKRLHKCGYSLSRTWTTVSYTEPWAHGFAMHPTGSRESLKASNQGSYRVKTGFEVYVTTDSRNDWCWWENKWEL